MTIFIAPRKATEAPPSQILLKDSLERYVLRRDLRVTSDVEFLMSDKIDNYETYSVKFFTF